MATINQELLDALIRHQIGLLRLSATIRNKVITLLNKTEADLRNEIERRLDVIANKAGVDVRSAGVVRRLQALEKAIAEIRGAAFKEVADLWSQEFQDLTKSEAEYLASAIKTVSPVILELALPEVKSLIALVRENAFEGRTLSQWAQDLRKTDISRINTQIRVGLTQGNTTAEIVRRVVGSPKLMGTDGVVELTRQNASSITRTATNFYANAAKALFYEENSDLFSEELFVATLDSRTTAICRSLDGERFPVGEGPRPPMHFGCRSLRVAIITEEAIGNRPYRNSTERQLVSEFSKGEYTSRDALPRGMKGKFDEFAQKKVREMTGLVPASTTYPEWFKRQSKAFQEEVLGKTKARLYRDGKMNLDRFVDASGRQYTLRELSIKDKKAFEDAGLRPKDFR